MVYMIWRKMRIPVNYKCKRIYSFGFEGQLLISIILLIFTSGNPPFLLSEFDNQIWSDIEGKMTGTTVIKLF